MDLAKLKAQKGQFFVKKIESELVLIVEGEIREDNSWRPTTFSVREKGQIFRYDEIEQIPAIHRSRFRSLVEKQGLEEQNLLTYLKEKGEIPSLDWALLAGFFSIAGIGGITNSLFSNYARDKAWGMGPGLVQFLVLPEAKKLLFLMLEKFLKLVEKIFLAGRAG